MADAEEAVADRYRPTGDGGRAVDLRTGTTVRLTAVDLPAGAGGGVSDAAVRRAVEAVRALRALPEHPHLVQVHDAVPHSGWLWLVTEWVPARTLASLLADGPPNIFRAAEVAQSVVRALLHLHRHGWLHRNITTTTVLVDAKGRVLLDGLAEGVLHETLCGHPPRPLPHPRAEDTPAARGSAPSAAAPRVHADRERLQRRPVQRPTAGGWMGDARRADAQRDHAPAAGTTPSRAGAEADTTTDTVPVEERPSGPAVPEDLEAVRQRRIALIGPVAERWAPEQATRVKGPLLVPAGPWTDLWALGATLFKALEGVPPYPDGDMEELLLAASTGPPALAEHCGPLRAAVEQLLHPDPEVRPTAQRLDGWLTSIIRTAPSPDRPVRRDGGAGGPASRSRVVPVSGRHRLPREARSRSLLGFITGRLRRPAPSPRAEAASITPSTPLPGPAPGPGAGVPSQIDVLGAILRTAQAGRHQDALALAAVWEARDLRRYGVASPHAIHWIEVRAELARLAGDPAQSCHLWVGAARARLVLLQPPGTPEVIAAVDRAHHQWRLAVRAAPDRARDLGPALIALRRHVPGKPGALRDLERLQRSLEHASTASATPSTAERTCSPPLPFSSARARPPPPLTRCPALIPVITVEPYKGAGSVAVPSPLLVLT
ncbi:protein kinase domain-containing protein [Streptomyces sp. S1]|uniref:protein kinase domain-containing protein n=1 Tax=Streptomyces sp. S1 TaxID=718288 RepID=UPI003D72A7D6